MAFSKQHKGKILDQYRQWVKGSQAIIALEYNKMRVKDVDALRNKAREAGGEFHVVKNTLMEIALKEAGVQLTGDLAGASLFGFAYKDAPALAKVVTDVTKNSETFKVKGGYLGVTLMKPEAIKSLADMPPLPVMRARLLGVLLAPASQLARTLAEPARSMASVVKAYSEKSGAPAEA